ncbi:mCG1035255 [Mus musculus]|nr:mCG1035255 [Mus musculus]
MMQNPGSFQNTPFLLHPELMEIRPEGSRHEPLASAPNAVSAACCHALLP